jgi:hypothetical protein
MRFPRREFWRALPRRLCAVLALLAYLVASIGCPVPAASLNKTSGQSYPCQHHQCGCKNAEQCWSCCCCYSAEEHLTWAAENNVTPPPKESPPPTGWQTTRLRDRGEEKTTHKAACPSCAAKERTEAARDRSHSCRNCTQTTTTPAAHSTPSSASGIRWISGISSRCCQGQFTLWISTGAVILPPPPPSWTPYFCAPEWLVYGSSSLCSLRSIPPDPPPRLFNS